MTTSKNYATVTHGPFGSPVIHDATLRCSYCSPTPFKACDTGHDHLPAAACGIDDRGIAYNDAIDTHVSRGAW